MKEKEKSHVRLLFNTHLDTVPPYIPPKEDEEKIYGRGCNDAKGQLAAMIYAANRVVEERPEIAEQIGLLFVVGEELDHIGMIEANKLQLQPHFLVVGEPTENRFASIQKGAFKFVIKTTGKAGHSGYPHTGVSAIHKLLPILTDIMNHDWPKSELHGDTTLNIGKISGGHALNAWAEAAEAMIFIRVTTSVVDVRERLEKIVGNRAELDYTLGGNDPVVLSEPPFEAPRITACFNTDLPYFDRRHLLKAVYLFGAGSITNAHSDDEFIVKSDLLSAVDTYFKLCVTLLS
ncbi:unnamed protein product, partial [Mesorhabditis belari]|uniref:Peptidase M20 dimerisation domain-containing protein n=1 Tax=Mesorhabditis belari TaxID=2138241 RepID=A0AAF3F3N0_9BILA